MPFGPVFSPSIGLSLLQAGLGRAGVASRIHYFTISFAERIGQQLYSGIAIEGRPSMRELVGEWLFAEALFGPRPAEDERYVEEVLRGGAAWPDPSWRRPVTPALVRRILGARRQVEPFLDECLDVLLTAAPRIVGFTSVFQQQVAALALARRLKQARPEVVIVFGGANVEGVMGAEAVRQFPFVDAAVSGEGDLVFPELVRRALAGEPLAGLPGVRTPATVERDLAAGVLSGAPPVRDMDALPEPDYRDYMEQFERSRFRDEWTPSVFFETSRGCWWGERAHCTFCGLNGQTMAYRSKSAPRALAELERLAEKHAGCDVQVVDNILDMGYFRDFLPALAEKRLDLNLFYETKANLKKDQIRQLRAAGIRIIQPGIESFSDPVLKLMRKGVPALQNVQLLKWCKELGIEPVWNVILGFPGEDPAEYARMAARVPPLFHLQPPTGCAGLRLDRFSPNFDHAGELGFANVRPLRPYDFIYPLPERAVSNLAYFFAFDYQDRRDVTAYSRPLVEAVHRWQKAAARSDLFAVATGDSVVVWDLRPAAREPFAVLSGLEREIHLACDGAQDGERLAERLGVASGEVVEAAGRLVERGLLLDWDGKLLSLAVPLGEYAPSAAVVEHFHEVLAQVGRVARGGWVVPLAATRPAARRRVVVRGARQPSARRAARLHPEHFVMQEPDRLFIRRLVAG